MGYIENPKTAGSGEDGEHRGIVCCIPQRGVCPVGCADCFFQSGRSYLEPLDEHLPNMPSIRAVGDRILRVNDGNDSNNQRELVLAMTRRYRYKFFNTSMPIDLEGFVDPVVLTVNPGKMTDRRAHLLDPVPRNLMFVRFRVNTWNLELADQVVAHYTSRGVPVVLTAMAYYRKKTRKGHEGNYVFKKRTLNSYWVLTPEMGAEIAARYADNPLVFTCGSTLTDYPCKKCNKCERFYLETMARLGR